MNGPQVSPPYSLRGGEDMVGLYQTLLRQQKDEEQKQFNQAKGTVVSLINSYHVTDSVNMKEQIAQTMRDYYGGLPHTLRTAVDPYIKHSPISPQEEKRREFLKYNRPPSEPDIPIGSWKENDPVWEGEWAKHLFAQSDYNRRMHIFMFNEASAPERKNFLPLGSGRAAMRSADDTVTVLDEKNLGIREQAKRLGLDEDKALQSVYLNNGRYPSGKKTGAIVNGTIFDYELDYNLLAGPGDSIYSRRLVGSKQAPLPPEAAFPKDLTDFMAELAVLNREDPGAAKVLDALDEIANISLKPGQRSQRIYSPEVAQYFETRWPGYTINIERTNQGSLFWRIMDWIPPFAFFIDDETGRKGYAANLVQGTLFPLKIDDGAPVPVYIDSQGVVRDKYNQVIGTNAEEARVNLQMRLRR